MLRISLAMLIVLGSINSSIVVVASTPDEAILPQDVRRVDVPEKGLSIIPPSEWEVIKDRPKTSLLLQKKYKKGEYQRSIQIMRLNGPRFIDETEAVYIKQDMLDLFGKSGALPEDYLLHEHSLVTLDDGTPGIMFYASMTINEQSLMQAHLVASASEAHYYLTYTDIKEHFDDPNLQHNLDIAWKSMITLVLDSEGPKRGFFTTKFLVIIATAVLAAILVSYIRRRKKRLAQESSLDGNAAKDSLDDELDIDEILIDVDSEQDKN